MSQQSESLPARGRWAIAERTPLMWKSWDDGDYVVYCTASGDTHRINEVTAEVLRQLERSDLGARDLSQRVARALGVAPDETFEAHVEGLLVHLDGIGLVEPAS